MPRTSREGAEEGGGRRPQVQAAGYLTDSPKSIKSPEETCKIGAMCDPSPSHSNKTHYLFLGPGCLSRSILRLNLKGHGGSSLPWRQRRNPSCTMHGSAPAPTVSALYSTSKVRTTSLRLRVAWLKSEMLLSCLLD